MPFLTRWTLKICINIGKILILKCKFYAKSPNIGGVAWQQGPIISQIGGVAM